MAFSTAAAQVLEIGDGGEVTVYSAPAVFTADGVRPIVPAAPRQTGRSASEQVNGMIAEASLRYAVPSTLVRAVAWRESRFHQDAVSDKGAIGVMQLMPVTARSLGVDPHDLRQNIHGGAAYLGQLLTRYRGDTGLALAAYNAGPSRVDRYGGAPPFQETRRYVADILGSMPPLAAASLSPLIFGQ